jgi:hypothetical protein
MLLAPDTRVLVAAAVLACVLGCGEKPTTAGTNRQPKGPAAGSPEATFIRVRDALRGQDFGAVHDLLSGGAKATAEAVIQKTVDSAAAMGPLAQELLGFDPAKLGGLGAREKYMKVMRGTYATSASLDSAFSTDKRKAGLAGGEVLSANVDGERATVTVRLPSGAKRAISLVREEGAWKLAKPLSFSGETAGDGAQPAAKPEPVAPKPTEAPAAQPGR